MRILLKKAAQILSAVIMLLTLLAYLCPHVNPASFQWFAFFGTAFPWILLANVFFVLLWAWRLNWLALIHLGVILFGWEFVSGFVGFNFGKDSIPEHAVTIATHNLGGMFYGKKLTDASREKMASAYAQHLQENGFPDILCTQETSAKFYRLLAQKMGYEHTFNLKKGTVILSRFPMLAGGDIPFANTSNSSIWVDIRIGKKVIRVYNLHLQSNSVTTTTEKVIDDGELDQGETWNTIGKVLGKVGNATSIRAEQAQRLREHIAASKYPALVCGDFNDTPNSYVYATLSNGLNDTFRDKGFGLATTFGGALPLLRIDYILSDPEIKTFGCKTVKGGFSDHFAVFATLGW